MGGDGEEVVGKGNGGGVVGGGVDGEVEAVLGDEAEGMWRRGKRIRNRGVQVNGGR